MSPDAVATPERVGRYDVVLALRKDDRGAAYLARASGLGGFDRFVVLEIAADAFQSKDGFAKILVEEAARVANLRHTNVVPVYDVGEDGAGVYLVAEYVPGATFDDPTSLPKDVALRILVDAVNGLHAAHEHADDEDRPLSLVHGDFAFTSVVVGTDGIARIADLPLARASRRAAPPLGDRWASPERTRNEALDRRADVWSAAAVAWEILTGRPFAAEDASDPPRVKTIEGAASLSDELETAVASALRVDRDARTATAAAFAKELASAARAAGMLAEPDRVVEHVQKIAGAELAERRAKVASARKGASEPATEETEEKENKPTMIGVAASDAELPDLPPAPIAPKESPISVLALQVDLSAYVGDRANTALLGAVAPPADAKEETRDEPEVYASPVAVPSTKTKEHSARAMFAGPLAKHEKIAIAAGGGLVFVALAIGLVKCATGPSASASASTASSSSASAAASAETASAPLGSSSAGTREGFLHVTANGAIAKVAIGARSVDVVPESSVQIELLPSERGKSLRVFVTSTDGRVASATADPGVRGLEVVFGDRDTLPPPPPPPSASVAQASARSTATPAPAAPPKEKRTWPKRGPRK